MTTRVPLIFGTMTIGSPGKNGVRTSDSAEVQAILDTFFKHGHTELDTARMYAEGTTEGYLAKSNLGNATLDTKVYPVTPGDHSPAKLRSTFSTSLSELSPYKVRVFYLHAPDRSVPFEETLEEIDKLFKEGKFEIFGLSNYAAWEVAEIVGICKARGYVLPQIYQGMYNAITRDLEKELLPCIRKFGLRLVVYNPLAGGFFAGKIASLDTSSVPEGRFGGSSSMAEMYRKRYFNDGYVKAIESLKGVAEKHNLRLTEVALRWLQHHSALKETDGVILGASSKEQLEANCIDSAKGPLPDEVVSALDDAWDLVKPYAPPYWR